MGSGPLGAPRTERPPPLRADLVENLRTHLAEKLAQYRRQTLKDGRTEVPIVLPSSMKLLDIPQDLVC